MIFEEQNIIINGKRFNRQLIEKIINVASNPSTKHVVVDGFCGLGGVTAGFSQLPGWVVIACINHWGVAIKTHSKNFPVCLHMQEDFRTADISIIMYMLDEIQRRNPLIRVHLWLSLECTNFSIAKGGMPRDADSRTLADFADRYVEDLAPHTIWIENVKEFKLWGPMIPKTKEINGFEVCLLTVNKKTNLITPWLVPDPQKKGEDFNRWKKHICSYGYSAEEKLLNCADYGIPQHRVRLIMQFNRTGIKANYPQQTHDKNGRNGLPKWQPVKPCLDLNDEGESVLSFKMQKGKLVPRIKSEKTIRRLMNGIARHVLPERENDLFITKYPSNSVGTHTNNGNSVENPSAAITTQHRIYPTKVHLIDHYFGNGYVKPIDKPVGTTGTKDGTALHSLEFLMHCYSPGYCSKTDAVTSAVKTKPSTYFVKTDFVDHQFSNGQQNKGTEEPAGAITAVPKQNVVTVDRLVGITKGNKSCIELDGAARTVNTRFKHYYLLNFQWFNNGMATLDKPSNTIIARQDKSPNYLITLETGELAIEVFEHDPPHYRELKKFMAKHGIVAINMRMLKEIELLRIMSIPEKTKLSKSSTNNKKMIGNAVPSDLVVQLGLAYCEETRIKYKNTAR